MQSIYLERRSFRNPFPFCFPYRTITREKETAVRDYIRNNKKEEDYSTTSFRDHRTTSEHY
jgi:hypothetical protein